MSIRTGFSTFDEFTLPQSYEKIKNEIDNFEINEEDVWVCSFPKSGTTWLQEMVWMILNDLDFERGEQTLEVRSPYLEVSGIINFIKFPNSDIPLYYRDSVGFVKSQKSPLVIKCHLPLNLLPNEIRNNEKHPKILYVLRDPRDVCVSYHHHGKIMGGFQGDLNQMCELLLSGHCTYGPYWKHVFSYWKKRNSPNFMCVKYEDMKRDLGEVIGSVAEFLERPLDDEKVDILKEHLSFETMKKNPSVNREDVVNVFRKMTSTNNEGEFMRSGKVGDYKKFMSGDYQKRFDEWIEQNTKNTDYVI